LNHVGLYYDCAATSLFVAMITRSGHTFFGAADDISLITALEQL
jgi:hypothetical protein